MNIAKSLTLLLFIVICSSCRKEGDNSGYIPKFVVEGGIEQNGYPYVLLTHNAPFFTSVDSAQLSELVIRWAKVTVSDGEQTEVLTAVRDDDFFPSYVYRGTQIKGVPGKTYTVTIEYAGNMLTSTTTIPKPVALDSIWFASKDDSLAQLVLTWKDKADQKNYYKIYTRQASDKQYIPTLLSNQNDTYFNGKEVTLHVNRGSENNLTVKNEPYFRIGDTVMIRFSSITKSGFEFWSSLQDEVLNASNPLIGSTGKIKSNINGPGIGVWCGYGSVYYKVVCKTIN